MKVRASGLFVVLLLLLGLAACGGGDDEKTAVGEGPPLGVSVEPRKPLAGETVAITGKAGPAGRSVNLERLAGSAWEQVESTSSGEDSSFRFQVEPGSEPVTYRVVAVSTGSNKTRISEQVELRTYDSGGTLLIRPAIGLRPDGKTELLPGVAAFTPSRTGAPVVVESRSKGGSWAEVASGEQDENGEFAFRLPASADADTEYRARSEGEDGAEELVTAVVRGTPWKFVWGDEFDGTELQSHWRMWTSYRPCTVNDPSQNKVKGGVLEMFASWDTSKKPLKTEKCKDGQFLTSQIGTDQTKNFTYGIFAARMKVHPNDGVHSAFWLYPAPGTGPASPAPDDPAEKGAEVDIVEYFGDDFGNGDYHSYVYWPRREADGTITNVKTGGGQKSGQLLPKGRYPSDDWHIYSVEWTPTEYIFRMDGIETSRVKTGISHREQAIILSMLASAWETPRLEDDSLPTSMQVDWVRVWQRDEKPAR
ncbi:glycoside hydrolase family 16 protein [Sporichthya polymorpha]|uniref:glycoside hydrolase family 16 protein n=1 Tax=Sporichthya polymorpha TaxID=35751 RepID=UPI0003769198|nr:glycoside hydrolase family 16 protein [Sporichthya polymorpha]